MHYKTCEICGLRAGRVLGQKRMFMAKFPLDEDRCKKWVKVTGKEDLAYVPIDKLHALKYICGNHFRPKDFKKKKTQLKRNAVPSVLIPAEPLKDEILIGFPLHVQTNHEIGGDSPLNECARSLSSPIESSTSTVEAANTRTANIRTLISLTIKASPFPTPRKTKILNKLKKSKEKIKNLKRVGKFEKISPYVLKSLIQSTVHDQNLKPKGKHWTKLNKNVALAMYNPKAYGYLEQLFPVPSMRTLQTVLQNMKMEPGIDRSVMTHLKETARSLTDRDKLCVILFDEMALNKRLIYNIALDKIDGFEDLGCERSRNEKIANRALVLMFQGLHKKVKQPIAYYFVKGTIALEKLVVIIETVIRAVTEAGYKVLATVCDHGPTNVGAMNLLKDFSGNPDGSNYYLVDNEKVFIIYDIPQLLNSIRNNFYNAGKLLMNNKKAKWSHLVQLEEINNSMLHFVKITKAHVNLKYKEKMRVKLAAQIFSNTVAAILKLQAESLENIDKKEEILETAYIIEDLDKLFDCTNGPASHKDMKKYIRTNVSKNSFHHQIWRKYIKKLKTLHFNKSDSILRLRNVRCVNGYITSILSLQDIWKYMESQNFEYLNLRQCNKDALENLFSMIRQHSPTSRNPTCHHFISALQSSILTRLSTLVSKRSNCEKDGNKILFDYHDIVFMKKDQNEKPTTALNNDHLPNWDIPMEENIENEIEEIEKKFNSFKKNHNVYVSGYIANFLLNNNDCQNCINALKLDPSDPRSYSLYNYISLKEWWVDKTCPIYPSIQLCEAIDAATKIFEMKIKPQIYIPNICKYAITVMLAGTNLSWMCKHHKSTMSKQLLRCLSLLLIRNECQIQNRSFASSV